jgi:DNA primase
VSIFEIVHQQVPLASVAARHTDLTPSGDTLAGRCPHRDHDDENPSFYIYPNGRFYCFGCRWHGDVTDFQAGVKGLRSGMEAALDLAEEFGIDLPEIDPEARKKAEKRRELEAEYLEQAQRALERLAHHPTVREWWEKRGFDEELRRRFLLGATDDGSATIPFWHQGRVEGIIRRKLEGEPKYILPKKEEFPEGYRPLFIPGGARGAVFLVEGYVDALAAAASGLDAVAVGGTGISQRQMEELQGLPGPIYVVPDNDAEGEKAARRWVEDLYPKAFLCPLIPPIEKEEENDD